MGNLHIIIHNYSNRFVPDQSYMLIHLPIRDAMLFYLHAFMFILVINHNLTAISYTDHILQTGKI